MREKTQGAVAGAPGRPLTSGECPQPTDPDRAGRCGSRRDQRGRGLGTLIDVSDARDVGVSAGDVDDVERGGARRRQCVRHLGVSPRAPRQWQRLRWQMIASLLALSSGSWLLLHLPEKAFTAVVPVLLVLGADPGSDRSADSGVGAPAS